MAILVGKGGVRRVKLTEAEIKGKIVNLGGFAAGKRWGLGLDEGYVISAIESFPSFYVI